MMYWYDIINENSLDVRCGGLPLIATKRAMEEIDCLHLSLLHCREILLHGYPAPRKRAVLLRKNGSTRERKRTT